MIDEKKFEKEGYLFKVWAEFVMGRVCMGRWAEFAMGRDVQLPNFRITDVSCPGRFVSLMFRTNPGRFVPNPGRFVPQL